MGRSRPGGSVNGVVPSTRRHRNRVARVQRAAAMAVVLALPLLAASSSPAAPSARRTAAAVPPSSTTTPLLALTPADIAASVGDLRDFRAVARKPAPSAPSHRLPNGDLASL